MFDLEYSVILFSALISKAMSKVMKVLEKVYLTIKPFPEIGGMHESN